MFHRYGKKVSSMHTKPLKDLTRIISAEALLAEEKRKKLVEQIQACCSLEPERYESLCATLLYGLVNHCQHLPDTSNNYYSQAGGMLDHALNRTEAALNLFKNYLLLDEKMELSEEQKLWQYALYTAALLQGIGKLQIDLTVQIYDDNGQFLKQWNPLLESLTQVGAHYSYRFEKEGDVDFRRRLNILMARFLMPASGYAWIVSNPKVLAVWLSLLNEDPYTSGTLGAILIHANALAIQRYLEQLNLKTHHSTSRYRRAGTFSSTIPDIQNDLQTGILFTQWITKSLTDGALMINKAPLLSVPGGILLCPDIYRLFVREHPEYKNKLAAVHKGLLSLGLHQTNVDGDVNFRYEQQNNQQMYTGVVCKDYAVFLPETVQLYHLTTGKISQLSATELIHYKQFNNDFNLKQSFITKNNLAYVNKEGEWEPIPVSSNTLSPTFKPA